jgi:hypothetical protein
MHAAENHTAKITSGLVHNSVSWAQGNASMI